MGRPKLYTKEQLREHRRVHYQKNRERIIADNTQRNQATVARRRELLREFPCRACGIDEPDVIQWHHYDPLTKQFELFRTAWPEEQFWDEVLKCVPLCANCHLKIHKDLICLIPQIR
jgi:predicted HNH restriction endonuclease